MRYTVIENTDVRVSRISFGTGSLHHLFSGKRRRYLLETAAAAGISHFDTSPYYGYGLAESDIGAFMRGRRGRFTVTTKVGLYPYRGGVRSATGVWVRKAAGKFFRRISAPEMDWCIRRASNSLHASLKRLKTDYVDFLFLHEPDIALINGEEFLRWLEAERSKGKVRYFGLAGLPELLEPWLRSGHPLAQVLQTKDDLCQHCADFIIRTGRSLQFTYGYLSCLTLNSTPVSANVVISEALLRNSKGSVLVSTRNPKHLEEIAKLTW